MPRPPFPVVCLASHQYLPELSQMYCSAVFATPSRFRSSQPVLMGPLKAAGPGGPVGESRRRPY